MAGSKEYATLEDVLRAEWLPPPERIDDIAGVVRIEEIRAALGGRHDG